MLITLLVAVEDSHYPVLNINLNKEGIGMKYSSLLSCI